MSRVISAAAFTSEGKIQLEARLQQRRAAVSALKRALSVTVVEEDERTSEIDSELETLRAEEADKEAKVADEKSKAAELQLQRQAVLLDDNMEIPARLQALIQTHLDRAQVWGDHCQTISAQIKTLEMEKSQIAKERSQIAESNRIAAIVNQNREAARQHLEQVIESLALLRWHFHQMDGIREAEPVQAGLHYLTDTDVVEPILRSHRFFLTKELTREEAHIVQQFEEEKPGVSEKFFRKEFVPGNVYECEHCGTVAKDHVLFEQAILCNSCRSYFLSASTRREFQQSTSDFGQVIRRYLAERQPGADFIDWLRRNYGG